MENNSINSFNDQDEIAIIGMAGRFPGANNVNVFWQNLQNSVESIDFFTDEELLATGVEPTLLNDQQYVKAGTVLEDIELFDASFFGFTPRDAEITDPQHRIFMECVWSALENAGYDSATYTGQIGLFAGTAVSHYLLANLYPNQDFIKLAGAFPIFIGNDKDHLTTQISYRLNLRGPSVNVQTTCSTSLVAVHLASQSLLNGESDIALAGGVSIDVPQKTGYLYQEGEINSPDGHCRAFDAQAQGTIFGSGSGVVVLKRLEDAMVDGDRIYAVIKASAINNDGSLKVGYTAPSVDGQREVILEALAVAGVEPETINYIEAHGTGTPLGDPIEIAALTQAFRTRTNKKGFCAIGSVKTNIGHLDAAAGVTGLIKTVLALKNRQIPASLHFQEPNPQIDFANSPFYVNHKLSEWQTNGTPRRAGVSSFGIGGTNAHVILEEAPLIEASSSSRPYQLLLLSAKSSTALDTATAQLHDYFEQNPDINLPDAAYTLQVGRRDFDYRRVVICQDLDDAVKSLHSQDPQTILSHHHKSNHCQVIFMFSGQGSQYINMGRELYAVEPTFTEHIDICAEILRSHLGLDIRSLLYPKHEEIETASQQLRQTALTQPALFITEYALAQLFLSWGVRPEAMIGHSIGEYVAATIAGVFSLEDALKIVATRGQLMQQVSPGSMLAIKLPEKEVQLLLDRNQFSQQSLEIAVINSPSSCVVSGSNQAVVALEQQLSAQEVECRLLHTSHAFHSVMMEPILKAFSEVFKTVKLNVPQIRFISNVTGDWITEQQATNPDYWCQHLRKTVRFSDGISQLIEQFEGVFLEVGPGRTLSTLTRQHLDRNTQQQVLTSLHHVKEQQSDVRFLLQTLGWLWLRGVEIDWSKFYTYEHRHRLSLPTYPFERQRYWIDAKSPSLSIDRKLTASDNKQDIANWFYLPSWKRSLLPNFSDNQIQSKSENWLFFIDDLEIGKQLSGVFRSQSRNVVTVKQGQKFSKLAEDIYIINPLLCEDYDTLIKELKLSNRKPDEIVYLWSVSYDKINQLGKYLEFNSLLLLTQSLSKQTINNNLQISLVSNNIQDVNGNEKLNPEKSTVLGLCKVIPQEYSHISLRCIDIALPDFTNIQARQKYHQTIVEQLLLELTSGSSDNVVAYRDRYRWVQTFEPVKLESVAESKIPLIKQGVYLFYGGLESTEVVLAEYLATTYQAKLIFIEDSTFPEQGDFSQWLETHTKDDEVSYKIKQLLALENKGSKVLVLRTDKTNYEQMNRILAAKNIGQINGVICSTEIKRKHIFASIPELITIELENNLELQHRKISVLERVLQNRNLDFCLVFSYLSSTLGGSTLGLYSASKQLIDTFINRRNQNNSLPWYIINWDKLQLNENQKQTTLKQVSGSELAINPTEIIEVFKRIFSLNSGAQVILSTVDITTSKNQIFDLDNQQNTQSNNQLDLGSHYSRPSLSNSYVAPTNNLEKQITEIWQEVLGIAEIGIYDNFYELGGDSLSATQLVSRLRTKFPVDLPLRELLSSAMIPAKQAEMLEQILLSKIEELSEEEVAVLLTTS